MDRSIPVWAAWLPNEIRIYYDQNREQRINRHLNEDLRYFLKFSQRTDGSITLRSGSYHKTIIDVIGDCFHCNTEINIPDELASLPLYQVFPLTDGSVVGVISGSTDLLIWRPSHSLRYSKLPKGFIVSDVVADTHNRLWICGASPSQKLKTLETRGALAVSHDHGESWECIEIIQTGFMLAWRRLLSGAEMKYNSVRLSNEYLVLSAETGDYGEPSTYILIKNPQGEWSGNVINHDVLRAVLPGPQGEPEIITHFGQLIVTQAKKKWSFQTLDNRIRACLLSEGHRVSSEVRFEILDVQQASKNKRILVISLRIPKNEDLSRFGEAVLVFSPDGDVVLTFHKEEDPEIIAASWLNISHSGQKDS